MPPIGLNTWLYASFPVWVPSYTLEDAITQIDKAGFDTIEVGAASPHAWPPYMTEERLEAVQDALDASDCDVVSICPALGGGPGPNPASPLEVEREAALDHYLGCIDVAEALGAEVVCWVGGWRLQNQRYEDAWSNMRGVFADVVDEAEDRGVAFAIEANPTDVNLIETTQDQKRLSEEVPSDTVGYMIDTAHALYRNESPSTYVEELADDLIHLHLADTGRQPPGEGDLSFRPLFDRLVDIGYDGAFVAEIFGADLNPDEAAWATARNLETMLEEVY